MERSQIVARLKGYLEREFPNQAVQLGEDTNLLEEWFTDSLGIVEMVMFLESEFGIRVGRADLNAENFATLGTLADFVHLRIGDVP